MNKNKKASKGTYKKVLECIRPYSFLVAVSILLSAGAVALTLYVPVLAGRAIDLMIGKGNVDLDGILSILTRIGIAVALTAVIQWTVSTINNRIAYNVVRDIRQKAFSHIQTLPLGYIDTHSVGETVSIVISDAEQFADGLLLGFSQFFTGVVTILGTIGFMISIRPAIAAVVVLLTPMSFVVARYISKHTYGFFKTQSETRGEQTGFIDEMIGNQKVVKAFGRERKNSEEFNEINDRLEKASLKAVFYSSLTNPCTRFVNNIVYAVVALAGALICVSTSGSASPFTVGALSALLAYANQYTKPFNEISGVITELQNAMACASRLFELTEETPEIPDKDGAATLRSVYGNVDIDGVSFSYTKERPLIENFDLHAKSGQKIAIVGPTGCGKTTFINLLMRFYDVNGGSVSVDGTDIRDIRRKSLRANYGMVLQETWLRSGTVRENIIMGKPDATDEEITAACVAAHAHGFIKRLPQGYDTVIGEDGGQLSQGQKQLLCIARIMLCLPPMLILDEATSSIDTRTEIKIQNAFDTMMKGRTSFIVAHRLSTIREADVIVVMKDGHIIEQGDHVSLLDKNGYYTHLYNSQFAQ